MRTNHLRAMLTMLAAVALFSAMDAGLKRMAASYPPLQVTFLRSAASLPFLLASLALAGRWRELAVANPLLYVGRGVLGVIMLIAFIKAVSLQGLSDTYAIFMSAPLMIVALSRLVLHEPVGVRRWAAIAVDSVASWWRCVLTLRGMVSLGGLMALTSAVCYAFGALSVRFLGRTDSAYAMVFWYMLLVTLGSGVLAWAGWHPVAVRDWPLVIGIGAVGAAAQHCFTNAFRLAPAAVIAPFEYTALVWGALLDRLVFSIAPTPKTLIGGVIVIAGGLYLAWDERRAASTRMESTDVQPC